LWKDRHEVYLGYLDGVISVYSIRNKPEELIFVGSFKIHTDAIHSIYILNDLKFAITSGFDSSLKIWQPPDNWEKPIIVTSSMLHNLGSIDNLSTIREETESYEPESHLIRRKFSAVGAHDNAIESILQQIN
jgi:WD40 repeat protein